MTITRGLQASAATGVVLAAGTATAQPNGYATGVLWGAWAALTAIAARQARDTTGEAR